MTSLVTNHIGSIGIKANQNVGVLMQSKTDQQIIHPASLNILPFGMA